MFKFFGCLHFLFGFGFLAVVILFGFFFLVLQDLIPNAYFSQFSKVQKHGHTHFQVSKTQQSKNQGNSTANTFPRQAVQSQL